MSSSRLFRLFMKQGYLLANLLVLAAMNLAVYVLQLAETNAYVGYEELVFDAQYVICAFCSLAVLSALMPSSIRRPSDFFCLFYGLFVVASYAVFHPIAGGMHWLNYVANFSIILLPLCVQRAFGHVPIGLRLPGVLNGRAVETLLLCLCLAGSVAMLMKRPESAGFDLVTVYTRRLEGRDIFVAGSLLAYLMSMISNGFLPFLAFLAGLNGRRAILGAVLLFALSFFYVLGLKAPFLYIGLAYLVGIRFRKVDGAGIHKVVFGFIWVLFAVFVVEKIVGDVSLVAELFFRRIFASPVYVMNNYFDLMFGWNEATWSSLKGIDVSRGVTYLVGYLYDNDIDANANTNAFVYALAAGGVPGYLATVALTTAVFFFFDMAYRGSRNFGFAFLGFAYALLLTEQSATTALLSSGIGVVTLLVLLWGGGGAARRHQSDRLRAGGRDPRALQ